ncbi:unnamed protein product [Phytomonas sp. Hart1]|nr:unnamed protein product [Phytomonas sp. Hart1]|eukprot:CCW68014.1 unnamed protein product [Phytomonas sp. isolate Hart1]
MSSIDMLLDGALASCFAVVFSNPLDTMRTRMQLQGQLCRSGQYQVIYRNIIQGMLRVAREEGLLALQKGLGSSILWQISQNGVRIGLYPALKEDIGYLLNSEDSLLTCATTGGLCGFIGTGLASPFMLVKTRLQSQHNNTIGENGQTLQRSSIGQQHHYKGICDAFRTIYRENGILGWWHGSSISVFLGVTASILQLTAYDRLKFYICEYANLKSSDIRVHALSSILSTCIMILFLNPIFLISTRVYNNPLKGGGEGLLSLFPTIVKTFRVEGIRGMYKGSTAYGMRSVPHFLFTFIALEQLRSFREKYTNRSYTTGTKANKNIGYFKRRHAAAQHSSQLGQSVSDLD